MYYTAPQPPPGVATTGAKFIYFSNLSGRTTPQRAEFTKEAEETGGTAMGTDPLYQETTALDNSPYNITL